jgi:hypothetical protein
MAYKSKIRAFRHLYLFADKWSAWDFLTMQNNVGSGIFISAMQKSKEAHCVSLLFGCAPGLGDYLGESPLQALLVGNC